MPDNCSTRTHTNRETPYVMLKVNPGDIEPRDWAFLRKWAKKLGISIEVLLERILIAGVIGQLYAEKIPFEIASGTIHRLRLITPILV